MPSGIECQCCREMEGIVERLTEDRRSLQCITDHEQFKVVCLNKNVLYTVLVTMKAVRGDTLHLPLANGLASTYFLHCRYYRVATYRQFIYWAYHRLGRGVRIVLPSCVVLVICKEFPNTVCI